MAPTKRILLPLLAIIFAAGLPTAVRAQDKSAPGRPNTGQQTSEPYVREEIRIRYLQPKPTSSYSCSGRAEKASERRPETVESLERSVEQLLRENGDARAKVERLPGKNVLAVTATPPQLARVRSLVEQVDRPRPQFIVRATVFTLFTSKQNYTLSDPFLSAEELTSNFDRLERDGVLRVQARLRGVVGDGSTLCLATGYQVPTVARRYRRAAREAGMTSGLVNASRVFEFTPRLIEGDAATPARISADVFYLSDTPEAVPPGRKARAVNRQSVETSLVLRDKQTVLLGGLRAPAGARRAGRTYVAVTVEEVPRTLVVRR